jgi:hypothetical protein
VPASSRPAIASPAAGWALAALVVALCVQLAASPAIGLPLIALALMGGLLVVFVLLTSELDADVVHVALIGAVAGTVGESWLLGEAWWHGLLFGMLVGGLVGDEIQLSGKWLKLARLTREESRWWQRLPLQSRWLPRAVWVAFAAALVAAISMPWWLPQEAGSQLARDFFATFRERREEAGYWSNVGRAWFAIVPLSIAIALSRFVARLPNQAILIDGLLRRIAVLQAAALLMLAVNALLIFTAWPSRPAYSFGNHYEFQLSAFVDLLRVAMVPCMLLMLSQLFLGKRLALYWARSGWILALGALGLMMATGLGFMIVFMLEQVA